MNGNQHITVLQWPPEAAKDDTEKTRKFSATGSNLVLDFHGNPTDAGLAVYSDGNHHMALEACVREFYKINPNVIDVFYTTTPPGPLVEALKGDGLTIGNLKITRKPDVFIGPKNILDDLVQSGYMKRHTPFAQSRGNVILVRKGNPKSVKSIKDFISQDIIIACSNPVNEKASYGVYELAAMKMAQAFGIDEGLVSKRMFNSGKYTRHSQVIHHREIPEMLASGQCDAAIIYYHLALRYCRIFPDIFEMVDINNVANRSNPDINPVTVYHIGLVGNGGEWGGVFMDYILSKPARKIYEEHGLMSQFNL